MNINSINSTNVNSNLPTFGGLIGRKVVKGPKMLLEMREVDRYYPFPGETKEMINKAVNHIKNLKYDKFGRMPYAEGEIKIEKELPFTKKEWADYRLNGVHSAKSQEIENVLALNTRHGLASTYGGKVNSTLNRYV